MPITACFETLLVNGDDIRNWAYITNAEELIGNGPQKGDLIVQDWVAGAIWQPGPKGPWTFNLPVVMKSREQDVALAQLRVLQGWEGNQAVLTRRLTVDGDEVSETCQAVMASAVQVLWDFRNRQRIEAVLVWQALNEWLPIVTIP